MNLIITIPFKTPSVNHLHNYWRGHVTLSGEARKLKSMIKDLVPAKEGEWNEPLKVVVFVYEDWYCKNGEVSRKDVDNRTKFIIDSVFEALGIDDKYIFSQLINKIQSETEEKSVILIEGL